MISGMNTISIKIDAPLESMLSALSQRERVSKSELMRRALKAYADRPAKGNPQQSALDLAGDLVGCLQGGPSDLSSNPAHMEGFGSV